MVDQRASSLIKQLATQKDNDHHTREGDLALLAEEYDAGTNFDFSLFLSSISCPPLFSTKRIVVLRNANQLDQEQVAELISYMSNPLPTTVLVLVTGQGALAPKLRQAFSDSRNFTQTVDTTLKGVVKREQWINEQVKRVGVQLDASAKRLLISHMGEDLSGLSGLLEVLKSAFQRNVPIGEAEIKEFLGEPGTVPLWELTDMIDKGNTAKSLEVLNRILNAGMVHPLAVMALLHRHYSAMMRLDSPDINSVEQAGRALDNKSSFAVEKLFKVAKTLQTKGIINSIKLLAKADLDLRGASGLPAEAVLEVLVARLARIARVSLKSRGLGGVSTRGGIGAYVTGPR